MIINSSKVKTEALLLICRDIIESYRQNSNIDFDISDDMSKFIDKKIDELLKALNSILQSNDYYIRNARVSRINIILKTHTFLQKLLEKNFSSGDKFDPAMLCFAFLSTWFAELQRDNSKEFLYFRLYPYSEVYDKLLLNIKDKEFKTINIKMLHIAEDICIKLDNYRFK